jgi:hypothetical protein
MADFFSTRVDHDQFEPFPFPEADVIDGTPNGGVHWLRQDASGTPVTGIFRSDSAVVSYAWDQDETIHVLEGTVEIVFDDGERLPLRPGDVASFAHGQRAVWHITGPFKELFVLSDRGGRS